MNCKTCGQEVKFPPNSPQCTNCWEVEKRLDEYLKSEKGRDRVQLALRHAIEDAKIREEQAKIEHLARTLSADEIKRRIAGNKAALNVMGGSLYPGIASDEIDRLERALNWQTQNLS